MDYMNQVKNILKVKLEQVIVLYLILPTILFIGKRIHSNSLFTNY